MKILVICQYYRPEPFRISDICEELVRRGHEVTVVTGTPNYPMGEIYPGYAAGERSDEVIGGVTVHRCPIIPRKTGTLYRLLNYFSYPRQSSGYVKRLGDFDVVFINQLSPVMMAEAGLRYAKAHRVPSVLYCLDLWPESLAAGGIRKTSPVFRFFRRLSAKIYRRADRILVSSRSFSDYFKEEFGITDVVYLPQYAEDLFRPEQCRKTPDEYTDLMFAGNVGTAQSVRTVIEAAQRCRDLERLRWHIVGDGIELDALRKASEGLPVFFHGRKPIEEMPQYYAMADAMLVTMQKNPTLSLTLPGKVQSYMAAGKPVIGAIDGETPRVVDDAHCGFVAGAEDSAALEQAVRAFVASSQKEQMGHNARQYYDQHFSKQHFFDTLIEQLEK